MRINPIHQNVEGYFDSKEEIDAAIDAGADILMLPFFRTVKEVEEFIAYVYGRVQTCLLLVTPEAANIIDEILDVPGIIHKGPLEHDLLPKYLNCADVFIMPTQKEGCCNAIVEALAMGLPVISSNGAFNDDILDEKNSIRINPDDVDAIADAIKKLKDDTMLRHSMTVYSLSRHKEYTIEGRAKRIVEFIEKQIICKRS